MSSYSEAGVDVAAAGRFTESIAGRVTATWGGNVVGTFGGFAAGLTIPPGYDEPVLMMTTDGVGTKAEIASATTSWPCASTTWQRREPLHSDSPTTWPSAPLIPNATRRL